MECCIKLFKELTVEDLYEISKIRNEVFVVEQNCVYQDCDDKDKEAYHLFIRDKQEIIAYLRILGREVSYQEVSIGRVLSNKNYRGQGFGRAIMMKAIEFINNTLNENEVRISAQEYAIPFYETVGFKVISESYLEDNIPHVEMLLILK